MLGCNSASSGTRFMLEKCSGGKSGRESKNVPQNFVANVVQTVGAKSRGLFLLSGPGLPISREMYT